MVAVVRGCNVPEICDPSLHAARVGCHRIFRRISPCKHSMSSYWPRDEAGKRQRQCFAVTANQSLRCSDACSATLPPIMRVGVSCAAVQARLCNVWRIAVNLWVHRGDHFWCCSLVCQIYIQGDLRHYAYDQRLAHRKPSISEENDNFGHFLHLNKNWGSPEECNKCSSLGT